jgi:hypothetical protein
MSLRGEIWELIWGESWRFGMKSVKVRSYSGGGVMNGGRGFVLMGVLLLVDDECYLYSCAL